MQLARCHAPRRCALGLTQEEFSVRFRVPLGTVRDWEQGKTEPDQAARAYLKVIAADAAAPPRPRWRCS
ncbi:MAG TPA: helix-turn-helix domain-containing protein [Acetobacteraceae bacterium]|nr:helix-turn-helix domain-containing protein [Acetobacteraceae bacterium]